jgi:hypothetical protein
VKKLILILVLCLIPSVVLGLSPEYKSSLIKEFHFLIMKNPGIIYSWGSADPYGGKADCSGYIFGVYKHLGIFVQRTTAKEMRVGNGNWKGKDITLEDADEMDIVWFSWKDSPNRPFGHIGVLIINPRSKLIELTHASSTQGKVVLEPLKGVFLRDLSATRRITLGEKEDIKLGKGIKKISP